MIVFNPPTLIALLTAPFLPAALLNQCQPPQRPLSCMPSLPGCVASSGGETTRKR